MTNLACEHYDIPKDLLEYSEPCEDCGAPMLISCCNDELDPEPSNGGFCPTCKEHCL
jgi:hypothetical protein